MRVRYGVALVAGLALMMENACLPQKTLQTEAEKDGFAGPVKAVSTVVTSFQVQWQQPDGPTLALPVFCHVCEYDPDGTRTRNGQTTDTGFTGENIQLTRDGKGKVIERRGIDAMTGELFREETLGPYGVTQEKNYNHGALSSSQIRHYDENGNLSEWLCFDAKGNLSDRTHYTTTKSGDTTEETNWDSKGQMKWQKLYDPVTDTDSMVTFDDAGVLKLSVVAVKGRVTSFWKQSEEPREFGDSLNWFKGDGNAESARCHAGGSCDRSLIHYEYQDPPHRNPTSAEWRDDQGRLLYAAYAEYEEDQYRNWTHRKVWVIGPDLPERTLYEEDSRVIVYW